MALITLVPVEQERDGGKQTRETTSVLRHMARDSAIRARREQMDARNSAWMRIMSRRNPNRRYYSAPYIEEESVRPY